MKWIGFDLFSFDVFFDLTLSFYFCLLLFVVFLIVGSPLPSPLVGCYWCWCMFLVPWIFCCCFGVCVPFFLCLSLCRSCKQASLAIDRQFVSYQLSDCCSLFIVYDHAVVWSALLCSCLIQVVVSFVFVFGLCLRCVLTLNMLVNGD